MYLLACLANDESHFSSKADNARTRPLLFIQQRHVLDEWSRYFGEKWRLNSVGDLYANGIMQIGKQSMTNQNQYGCARDMSPLKLNVFTQISDQSQWRDRDQAVRGQAGPGPGRLPAAQPPRQGDPRRAQEGRKDLRRRDQQGGLQGDLPQGEARRQHPGLEDGKQNEHCELICFICQWGILL